MATQTKYTVTARDRWAWDHPRLSDHAADRWDERAPDAAVAPETAWEDGVEVPEPGIVMLEDRTNPDISRARVWTDGHGATLILIVADQHNPAIVTVYDAASRHHAAERAFFHTLAEAGSR